mmetsp:Transcript_16156/g.37216  ORF Transcript_16156/g.37216 Transcript_16156/m.37216 type:complete len:467 (-) Transcript_16156:250-1650(-)
MATVLAPALHGGCSAVISKDEIAAAENHHHHCHHHHPATATALVDTNTTIKPYGRSTPTVPAAFCQPKTINTLLDDTTLAGVLSHLTWEEVLWTAPTVCRQWRNVIAQQPHALPGDELFCNRRELYHRLPQIAARISHLRALRLDYGSIQSETFTLEPQVLRASLRHWQHSLQSLTLRETGLTKLPFGDTDNVDDCPILPNLTSVDLSRNAQLEWKMKGLLRHAPHLQQLRCSHNPRLTGQLNELSVIRSTLTHLCLWGCQNVRGQLSELADFPQLQHVNLDGTSVVGTARQLLDVQPHPSQTAYFPALETLQLDPAQDDLCSRLDFDNTRQVGEIMQARHALLQRYPKLRLMHKQWYLSVDSTDRYSAPQHRQQQQPGSQRLPPQPPMAVEFVRVGACMVGWRWTNSTPTGACHTHWLTKGQQEGEENNAFKNKKQLAALQRNVVDFAGHWQPPTRQEYWQQFVL